MHPLKKAARIAGAIYASMVVTGPFSLIYVPSKLIVRGERYRNRQITSSLTRRCFVFRSWLISLGR